ncbi:uncharacterized protein LOC129953684 [Eupeodes corollae]|uniref:uncharacterized protein LOC129953684 n=1 Tax=Eupeodes corollae TaxID=290404 RepID=UPI00248F9602|nr:uncharacterized protein LOC129953684 [Eupeodes corollae]
MKISLLKWNIQTIVTSLNKLQMHRDNIIQNPQSYSSEVVGIVECKRSLENAFANLEPESLNKTISQIKKRKTKRLKKKLKTKKRHNRNNSTTTPPSSEQSQSNGSAIFPFVLEQQHLSRLNKCKLRSSKKYLAWIECLETLHRLKGGGDSCKLKESLNSIKSFWQSTEQSIKEEKNNNSLAKRWDKVLFGGKSEIEIVPSLEEFLGRRYIWDSYLDNSNGSHIPIGWVYPKEDARPEWKQFLQLI